MTSILKVDTIQGANGSDIPYIKGHTLQTVVHQELGMTFFTAGTAGTDLLLLPANAADSTSHLSLTITPKSTSSKILLTTSIFFEGSTAPHEYLWTLYRGATKLGQPNVGSRRGGIMMTSMGHYSLDVTTTPDSASFSYYDTPNTTSAITYAVAFNHSTSSVVVHLNKGAHDDDANYSERGVSILIAQEIGG